MISREKLYKKDSKGNTRVWWLEYDEVGYRTHAGILDGKIVVSKPTLCEAKNVGRANETTVAEQVIAEVNAEYEKKQFQGKYHANLDDISKGAQFVECMLAQSYKDKKHGNGTYWSQPKLDGMRCVAPEFGLHTRNGKPIPSAAHIYEQLEAFRRDYPDYALDGELYNHEMKDKFEELMSVAKKTKPNAEQLAFAAEKLQYHIYDVITPEPMTFKARQEFLTDFFSGRDDMPSIRLVPSFVVQGSEDIDATLAKYLEEGYEGQMLRIDATPYECGKRSQSLIKHKNFDEDEFEIVDVIEGKGNWSGYAKALEIRLPDGSTQQSGMRGNQEKLRALLQDRERVIGSQATIRFFGRTADEKLRFPVMKIIHEGKRFDNE